jgi:hypothetical protein
MKLRSMPPKDPTIEEAKAFRGRARPVRRDAGEPMTIGNMRENGVRSLAIWCLGRGCEHQTSLNVDHMAAEIEIPTIGPRMVCTRCGFVGADARPNWSEITRR